MSGCSSNLGKIKKLVYVSIVDWAFVSHRLTLADEAIKRGFAVYLITKDTGKFDFLRSRGIICINLNFSRSGLNLIHEFINIITLIKIYKKIKPDIIHHIALKTSIYGTIAGIFITRKTIIINAITGLGYLFTNENKNNLSRFIIQILIKITNIFRNNYYIFQNLNDFGFFENLGVIKKYNYRLIKGAGVDPEIYFQKDYSIKNIKIKIVLVARMLKDKGIIEFIEAAKILKDKYENQTEFILVGGIDLNNPAAITEENLNSLLVSNYIIWMGYQDNIRNIYTYSDIVCLPSYREGIPKSLIEAMSVGCPIVTTNAIGCKECVDHGINGFLVPTKDYKILSNYLEQLILNEDLRIRMGRNSRNKMIKEMSLSKVINETFNFYEQLTT